MIALTTSLRNALATAAIVATLSACTSRTGQVAVLDKIDEKTAATRAPAEAKLFGVPLRTGQLVLTEAPGSLSYVIALIPENFYAFTHGGIVSVEDGQPYVYDVSGELATIPTEQLVLANVKGAMRRTPFLEYVAPNLYAEVHDLPAGVDGRKVAAFARTKFQERAEFDAFFDYTEHSRLFCTELLALALEAGGAPPRALVRTNRNGSIQRAMEWLAVPTDTVLPAGAFAEGAPYVGAFGQFESRSAAYSYFEAKREFHRRFKRGQRLGYAFSLRSTGSVEIRPEVELFFLRASHLFDGEPSPPLPGDARIALTVRRLADDMFGPVAD